MELSKADLVANLKVLKERLEKKPLDLDARMRSARTHQLLGESSRAISHYRAVARFLSLSGRPYPAIAVLQELLTVDSTHEETLLFLAKLYARTGAHDGPMRARVAMPLEVATQADTPIALPEGIPQTQTGVWRAIRPLPTDIYTIARDADEVGAEIDDSPLREADAETRANADENIDDDNVDVLEVLDAAQPDESDEADDAAEQKNDDVSDQEKEDLLFGATEAEDERIFGEESPVITDLPKDEGLVDDVKGIQELPSDESPVHTLPEDLAPLAEESMDGYGLSDSLRFDAAMPPPTPESEGETVDVRLPPRPPDAPGVDEDELDETSIDTPSFDGATYAEFELSDEDVVEAIDPITFDGDPLASLPDVLPEGFEILGALTTEDLVLPKIDLFKDLSVGAFVDLGKKLQFRRLEEGEPLFYYGDPATSIIVISRGQVEVSRPLASGEDSSIEVLGEGDFLGLFALLGGKTRNADARAKSDLDFFEIELNAIDELMKKHPTAHDAVESLSRERLGLQALAEVLGFSELAPKTRQKMASTFSVQTFNNDDILLAPGTQSPFMAILSKGHATMSQDSFLDEENASEVALGTLFVHRGGDWPWVLRANKDAELMKLDTKEARDILDSTLIDEDSDDFFRVFFLVDLEGDEA